jgi:hypothetical protein
VTSLFHRRPAAVLGSVVVFPLVLAAVVLLWRPWVPVLDMAMTELRVRDVGGSNTPLVGLPGRIGDFPDQGSHPGAWSFYLIAPFYRLAWSTAWGMELASVVINAAAGIGVVVLGKRRFGAQGALVFAAIVAIAIRGYGLTVLTHPWNPYFPVLIWLLTLVAAWFVLLGDHWLAVMVVVTSTVAAQTHVPYLVSAIAIDTLVLGALVWSIVRARREQSGDAPVRPLIAMVGVGALLWVPPIAEQINRDNGNIRKLLTHFATEPPDDPIGLGSAGRLLLQHLDIFSLTGGLLTRDDSFVHRAGQTGGLNIGGLVVLALWLAAIVVAVRRRHGGLTALHAVTATALFAGWVSISRIFGKVWFYLTLWMSSAVLLATLSILWTAWVVARDRGWRLGHRHVRDAALVTTTVATVLSVVAAIGHQVPEDDLAEDVRVIMPTVTAALDANLGAATGKDGSYVVFWQESVVPGAQGYALMNELERRGYRVGVHPTWRVPATPHRVREDGEYDAEVHMVSGAWIDEWRTREGYVEVIEYDDRSDDERERFTLLESKVTDRLLEIGRGDLIDVVDTNIFGASLTPGLPDDIVADLGEMLVLGEPVAVFIAPAGSTF